MITLIFASNNQNKIDEIRSVVGNEFLILSLKDAGINIDIPEPFNSLEANAKQKNDVIFNLTGTNCFSEDTGLEVEALSDEPGVKSARYAGDKKDDGANIQKLLLNLKGIENRKARFRTVISLIYNNSAYLFEGICEGHISNQPIGEKGFGYDPVFIPDGSDKTFAEMEMSEKNKYSHRKKATAQLVAFLSHVGKKPSL